MRSFLAKVKSKCKLHGCNNKIKQYLSKANMKWHLPNQSLLDS